MKFFKNAYLIKELDPMNCAFVISHTLIHDQIFQESETMGVITVRRLMLMTMMFIVLVPDVVQG